MEQALSVNQINCQWCSKPMNSDAIRCPNCGKLRKDIYKEKIQCWTFSIFGGLMGGLGIALLRVNRRSVYEYYYLGRPDNTAAYVLLVAGILLIIVACIYYLKVSQKLKTYWWV